MNARGSDYCAELQAELDDLRDEENFWEAELDDPPGTLRRGQIALRLRGIRDRIRRVETLLETCNDRPPDPIEQWLESRPQIASAIVWRERDGWGGTPVSYRSWTRSMKADLAQTVVDLRGTQTAGVPATPGFRPLLEGTGELNAMLIDDAYAWLLFRSYVAQSLVVEIDGTLGWSLQSLSPASLALLFDAKSIVFWYYGEHSFSIWIGHGLVTPSDPGWTFSYLQSADLVGATRRETLDRVVDWCRTNLRHFLYNRDPPNLEDHWQYEGWPPVERIIEGTVSSANPSIGEQHYTAGCWGTAGFLRALLRTVNIPVDIGASPTAHALPGFPSEGLNLSHGDDPYSQISKWQPLFPIDDLFIDDMKYSAWFGPSVPPGIQLNNVGRQPTDLAIRDLPNDLLRLYCNDQAQRLDHANGQVYSFVAARHYTVQELEAQQFWERMDAKIAQFDGCSNIP